MLMALPATPDTTVTRTPGGSHDTAHSITDRTNVVDLAPQLLDCFLQLGRVLHQSLLFFLQLVNLQVRLLQPLSSGHKAWVQPRVHGAKSRILLHDRVDSGCLGQSFFKLKNINIYIRLWFTHACAHLRWSFWYRILAPKVWGPISEYFFTWSQNATVPFTIYLITLFMPTLGFNKWHHWIARWIGFLLYMYLFFFARFVKKLEKF